MSQVQDKSAPSSPDLPKTHVEITGRKVEVPEHFADRVHARLAKIERLDPTLTSFHVELQHEPNPRRADESDRIQITASGKGHLARAEAKEDSFYAALEVAVSRMERSLRKVKARRKIALSGHRTPISVGEATAQLTREVETTKEEPGNYDVDPYEDQFKPGQIVRRKTHKAVPMSVDDALSEMELVGHDFYLFHDEETDQPSVVYRRHAYDYGLLTLKEPQD